MPLLTNFFELTFRNFPKSIFGYIINNHEESSHPKYMNFSILLMISVSMLLVTTIEIVPSNHVFGQPVIQNDDHLVIDKITDNLDSPSSFEILNNDILITQKNDGKVRLIRDSIPKQYPVLDLITFNKGIDNGLKSIASGNKNNITYVFLLFSQSLTEDTDNLETPLLHYKVYRYIWNSSGLELTNETLILDLPMTKGVKTGGKMIVGPDDQLYITIGDLDREGKEQNIPIMDDFFNVFYNNNIKSSTILRVDFNGSASVDNPFTEEGFESYFAYGIRNSLGLAFDPITQHLWDTEQGPNSMDEINLVRPGFNSGWKTIQGFSNTTCCSDKIQTLQNIYKLYKIKGSYYDEPKAVFENSSNLTAVTFQGTDLLGTKYNNTMFVGDMLGKIYNFDLSKNRGSLIDKNNSSEYKFAEGFGPISDIKIGPDGKLYVLTYSNGFKYPYDKNTGALYSISTLDSPTQLSERNIISIEQIALIATFLIILSILVTLRFKYILRKLRN